MTSRNHSRAASSCNIAFHAILTIAESVPRYEALSFAIHAAKSKIYLLSWWP
jgi:hypothetical protein